CPTGSGTKSRINPSRWTRTNILRVPEAKVGDHNESVRLGGSQEKLVPATGLNEVDRPRLPAGTRVPLRPPLSRPVQFERGKNWTPRARGHFRDRPTDLRAAKATRPGARDRPSDSWIQGGGRKR